MTCFWNAILRNLRSNNDEIFSGVKTPTQLVNTFKEKNKQTPNVFWQGKKLSKDELKENYTWIKDYDVRKIRNGHLTSACDPFFCLLASLLNINIKHNYAGHHIMYTVPNSKKTWNFTSSRSHMN